jgi:hypothetical protein
MTVTITTDDNEEKKPEAIPAEDGSTVLLNLETLIKNHITGIDKRKKDLKNFRDMITSALANDETYHVHDQKAKEAAKLKAATKAQIMKQPQNGDVAHKALELAAEIKEMDEALSDYLREYERMSGSNEIEGDDGEVREIIYVAKLVKKSSR